MKGLIVKEPWIDLILDGKKPWEIRGNSTSARGTIALIKSGTGKIFGTAHLGSCSLFPLSMKQLESTKNLHCVEDLSIIKYNRPFAWKFDSPVRFENPIPYKHPQGAIIWVNLPDGLVPVGDTKGQNTKNAY